MASTIPTELGVTLAGTTYLDLDAEGYTGTIPTQLGLLTDIEDYFQLGRQTLTGSIPTQLGKLTKLTYDFEVYENSLTSTIPTQLGKFTGLTAWFQLQDNVLCGDIPTEVCKYPPRMNYTEPHHLPLHQTHRAYPNRYLLPASLPCGPARALEFIFQIMSWARIAHSSRRRYRQASRQPLFDRRHLSPQPTRNCPLCSSFRGFAPPWHCRPLSPYCSR
jgi:hypothetical protein